MEHYIITGATGYLGNTLVSELLKRGKRVIITLRTYKYLSPLYCSMTEVAYGDLRDVNFLKELINNESIVIHCAGVVELGKGNKKEVMSNNYDVTKNLLDVCIQNHAKKFIYISSCDALCKTSGTDSITEPGVNINTNLPSAYATSKALATKYVLEKAKAGEINANVVYPTTLIGPNDYKLSNIGEMIINFKNDANMAIADGTYNFVDIRDVVKAIITLSEKGKSGEDYILSGTIVSVREFFEMLKSILNKPKTPTIHPIWWASFILFFQNIIRRFSEKKVMYDSYHLKFMRYNKNFCCDKAKADIDFKTRPLDKTVQDTAIWLLDNKRDLIK